MLLIYVVYFIPRRYASHETIDFAILKPPKNNDLITTTSVVGEKISEGLT